MSYKITCPCLVSVTSLNHAENKVSSRGKGKDAHVISDEQRVIFFVHCPSFIVLIINTYTVMISISVRTISTRFICSIK
jgi:hypothetical protein